MCFNVVNLGGKGGIKFDFMFKFYYKFKYFKLFKYILY